MPHLYANWSAPANVHALTTLRSPGFSQAPYEANNLALRVGDKEDDVKANRQTLREALHRPKEPEWLRQIHSTTCINVDEETNRSADAAISRSPERTLVIMTADCLPIMLCNQEGSEIAAIHSGWRGLVAGVIENTLSKMQSPKDQLLAWIGPAICQSCYEVGREVFDSYQSRYPFAGKAFRPQKEKWLANLPQMAELVLNCLGVFAVFQAQRCTFEQKNDFYSYRRMSQTGRMASLIWFNEHDQDK